MSRGGMLPLHGTHILATKRSIGCFIDDREIVNKLREFWTSNSTTNFSTRLFWATCYMVLVVWPVTLYCWELIFLYGRVFKTPRITAFMDAGRLGLMLGCAATAVTWYAVGRATGTSGQASYTAKQSVGLNPSPLDCLKELFRSNPLTSFDPAKMWSSLFNLIVMVVFLTLDIELTAVFFGLENVRDVRVLPYLDITRLGALWGMAAGSQGWYVAGQIIEAKNSVAPVPQPPAVMQVPRIL